MQCRWTKDVIASEIIRMYEAGEHLNYASVAGTRLLAAAVRRMGTWSAAVSYAGIDYSLIRRYRSWTSETIIERIRHLHQQGVDLSWTNVSTKADPQLAVAATQKRHFGSWREALEAAGLDYDSIRRYQSWTDGLVVQRLQDIESTGKPLHATCIVEQDAALITAAMRFP